MALVNLFGSLALDQSVMAATPLLKQINTTLLSTPYVYVANPTAVTVAFPGVQNVNIANVSTPPSIQSVSLTSTPIVSLANTQVTVQNWPLIYPTQGVVNVNLANVATPISTQSVSVINWPGIQNVNVANPTTPVTSVGVNNFPLGFNVNVANPSTPPSVQAVSLTSTPIVYSYQPYPYSIQGTVGVSNFPASFSVSNFPATYPTQGVVNVNVANPATPPTVQTVNVNNLPGVQNVNLANQSTPAPVQQISFPVASQVANDGSLQGPQFQNINLFSTVAGTQATPLVLANSRTTRVLSYVFTSSVAGSVCFTSTPTSNFQSTGIGVTGINLGGPYTVGAQGGVSFSGTLQGPAFQAAAGTPVYIVASAGNVGGHITYVVI